ncbi:MAG TPA: hypothetical protein VK142_02665 [Bacillota bacterium]|nr:hypothetical protein [Bacillota bacterium]
MRKVGSLIVVGVMALFLSACGESEKEEIISLHESFHDLTDGAEEKMEEAEEVFMQYINGTIDESEFNDMKDDLNDYVSDKKDELDDIDKPKKDKAIEYYDISTKALTGAFNIIEDVMDVPDLTDEEAVMEYGQGLEEKVNEIDDDMQAVQDFQDDLKEEDDDYKDAFDD